MLPFCFYAFYPYVLSCSTVHYLGIFYAFQSLYVVKEHSCRMLNVPRVEIETFPTGGKKKRRPYLPLTNNLPDSRPIYYMQQR